VWSHSDEKRSIVQLHALHDISVAFFVCVHYVRFGFFKSATILCRMARMRRMTRMRCVCCVAYGSLETDL